MDKLVKNIFIYSLEGITESKGQDTYNNFEFDIEGINIKVKLGIEFEVDNTQSVQTNYVFDSAIYTDLDEVINYNILENAKYYKYLLLKSEQTAFINSTIFFLKDIKENHKDKFESLINEQETFKVIKNMIMYSSDYNKINDYEEMITNINVKLELENYFLPSILYYMIFNKQKVICKNDFINFKNFNTNKAKEISEKAFEYIRTNKQEYIKKLYDMIYVHILSDIYN